LLVVPDGGTDGDAEGYLVGASVRYGETDGDADGYRVVSGDADVKGVWVGRLGTG